MPRTPRQMHGRRAFAAAAAAGLVVSLFAPWYRETVVARGLTGLLTLTLTRSGWQAFSATELVVLVVAVLALLVVIIMPSGDRGGESRDRLRLTGVVVTVLGAIAFVVVLARLTTAPGTTKHALDETMVAIRWGIFLALACSAALTAAGLQLIRAARRSPQSDERSNRATTPPRRERVPRRERAPRSEREPRSSREPRPGRTPRQDRAARPDRAARAERARPEATHTEGPTPARTPERQPERQPELVRPARRSDRPLWDEQATGWLDLPD